MKKITFILFALIAGTTFAQNSDIAIATVNAEIVSPISIELLSGTMNFGKFTTSATNDATVTLLADGSDRTFSKTDMEITTLNTFDVPVFHVNADVAYSVELQLVTQVDGGLILGSLTSNFDPLSPADFSVGGTLTVPSTTSAGAYTAGRVSVTVNYN